MGSVEPVSGASSGQRDEGDLAFYRAAHETAIATIEQLEAENARLRAVVEARTFGDFWTSVEQVFPMGRDNAILRAEIARLRAELEERPDG